MSALSVRELNSNISKALSRVEAGETIDIMRNGKIIAELKPKRASHKDDPVWRAAHERLVAIMQKGVTLGGPFSYEDRTG